MMQCKAVVKIFFRRGKNFFEIVIPDYIYLVKKKKVEGDGGTGSVCYPLATPLVQWAGSNFYCRLMYGEPWDIFTAI